MTYVAMVSCYTIDTYHNYNEERFAGLNFHVFCSFMSTANFFPVNIIQTSHNRVVQVF